MKTEYALVSTVNVVRRDVARAARRTEVIRAATTTLRAPSVPYRPAIRALPTQDARWAKAFVRTLAGYAVRLSRQSASGLFVKDERS